ncbi:MAG: protein translocase subunit SecF, partial [Proteobacteria bacterium]|nr:protein translocase subunit SecF [Pseudomonadota bacterium]
MDTSKLNIDFMGARRVAVAVSAVVIAASLVSLVTRGLNFGLDITGGDLLELPYEGEADLADVSAALTGEGFE